MTHCKPRHISSNDMQESPGTEMADPDSRQTRPVDPVLFNGEIRYECEYIVKSRGETDFLNFIDKY